MKMLSVRMHSPHLNALVGKLDLAESIEDDVTAQMLQLQNGESHCVRRIWDPVGSARIFLSRLAELAHDGGADTMTAARILGVRHYFAGSAGHE